MTKQPRLLIRAHWVLVDAVHKARIWLREISPIVIQSEESTNLDILLHPRAPIA